MVRQIDLIASSSLPSNNQSDWIKSASSQLVKRELARRKLQIVTGDFLIRRNDSRTSRNKSARQSVMSAGSSAVDRQSVYARPGRWNDLLSDAAANTTQPADDSATRTGFVATNHFVAVADPVTAGPEMLTQNQSFAPAVMARSLMDPGRSGQSPDPFRRHAFYLTVRCCTNIQSIWV